MSEKIVQLDDEVIEMQLKELVRSSVEETLNGLLEAEPERLLQARMPGMSDMKLVKAIVATTTTEITSTSGDVTSHMSPSQGSCV